MNAAFQIDSVNRPAQPVDAVDKRHAQLTTQAQKWVSQTFFGTLLKQMHESPFKSDMFEGGRGGEAFSALFDQQLADRMSHASGKKLVNSIVRKIEGADAYRRATRSKTPAVSGVQK